MARRIFEVSHEKLLELLLGQDVRRKVLLDIRVDQAFGTVRIIVEDPEQTMIPEGYLPISEPLA